MSFRTRLIPQPGGQVTVDPNVSASGIRAESPAPAAEIADCIMAGFYQSDNDWMFSQMCHDPICATE